MITFPQEKVLSKEKVAQIKESNHGGLNCVKEAEDGGSTCSRISGNQAFIRMGTPSRMSVLGFASFQSFDGNYIPFLNYGTLTTSRVRNDTASRVENQM